VIPGCPERYPDPPFGRGPRRRELAVTLDHLRIADYVLLSVGKTGGTYYIQPSVQWRYVSSASMFLVPADDWWSFRVS